MTAPGDDVHGAEAPVERLLARYRALAIDALLADVPAGGPRYLYELIADYPRRSGKGLRAALCLAACRVFGGAGERAVNAAATVELFYGWYLGAAFQIQDDVLNLVGDYAHYGKEISGDRWEGKRTLILIDFLRRCSEPERERLTAFLATSRAQRSAADVRWVHGRLLAYDCVEAARGCARQLADAALAEGRLVLGPGVASENGEFLLDLTRYVVERSR